MEKQEVCDTCKSVKTDTGQDVVTQNMFQKFNDETTFHGVRYAFGRGRTFCQR